MVFTPIVLSKEKLSIITTTGMIADVVENIVDDVISVRSLMGTGVDPHLYRPTSGDIKALSRADIIFYNGLHLEGKMQTILPKMAKKRAVYAVGENIEAKLIYVDSYTVDPHIWMDIKLWRKVTKFIYEKLVKHSPNNQKLFETNYNNYIKKLDVYNNKVLELISSISKQKRILVTAHDAFSYFGQAYNIKVIGLQGLSTADEFGLNDIIKVQNLILENNVQSVFLESSVTPKFINSLQKGLKSKGADVSIGGELFSDAMGLPGTPEGTYLGMMLHNATIITNSLK